MRKGTYLSALLRSRMTVFSIKEIALLWNSPATNATQVRINAYVKRGELIHLRRGLYAKEKNYNRLELATRIYIPSYVSFETVLAQAGIIFQFYRAIFVASYLSREIGVDRQIYSFRKIRDSVLTDPAGIENKENYSMASKERAFLDALYLHANYHFDNLSPIDWDRAFEMLPIYQNKRLEKEVSKLHDTIRFRYSPP